MGWEHFAWESAAPRRTARTRSNTVIALHLLLLIICLRRLGKRRTVQIRGNTGMNRAVARTPAGRLDL
eukprot:95761-Lingulodinium_polyedra.AAC.1